MSAGDMSTGGFRGLLHNMRTRRPFQVAAVAGLVLLAVIVMAILEGDLPELVHFRGWRILLRSYGFLAGFGLLYAEESGVPLPAPGDVFVLYVGAHVPRNLVAWVSAWLGLILAVVLGATNLFFISRRFGRKLVESNFSEAIHLSPERLARAERWFDQYGVLAIIFGRHIPGFRVPITVAAGIFRIRYPVFAMSVAVSTAIWAGVVLIIGINYGSRFESFLRLHSSMYFIWGILVAGLIIWGLVRSRMRQSRMRSMPRPPVNEPTSR